MLLPLARLVAATLGEKPMKHRAFGLVICLSFNLAGLAVRADDLAALVTAKDEDGFQEYFSGTPYDEDEVRGLFRFLLNHEKTFLTNANQIKFVRTVLELHESVGIHQTKETPVVLSKDGDLLVLLHEQELFAGGSLDVFSDRQFFEFKRWFGIKNLTTRKPAEHSADEIKRQFLADIHNVTQGDVETTIWLNGHGSGTMLTLDQLGSVTISYRDLAGAVIGNGDSKIDMSNTTWVFETCFSADFAWRFANELATRSSAQGIAFVPPPLIIADTSRNTVSHGIQRAIIDVQNAQRNFIRRGYLSLGDFKPIANRAQQRKEGSQSPVFIVPTGVYGDRLRDILGDDDFNPFVQVSVRYFSD